MTKVFVNGTFDVLHPGHLALLNYARSLGDYVVVGIDTDDRVREKKGPSRPVNGEKDRRIMLLNLKSVDEVKFFGTDEELENYIFYEEDHESNIFFHENGKIKGATLGKLVERATYEKYPGKIFK